MKSNLTERGKGTVEVVGGVIQEGVGKIIGDETMEAKGAAHQVLGHARDDAAKASERVKGTVEEIVGVVKNKAGKLFGDKSTEVDGKVEELKGKARQALNK